jgi:maltose phosphorylase
VAESVFSLANEYMGVRGFFEEGYSGDSLPGCYYNGSFERMPIEHPYAPRGFVTEGRFMVAAPNWLWMRLEVDGEALDLAKSDISGFSRELDMRTGVLTRSFRWRLAGGGTVAVRLERFVSMARKNLGAQRVRLQALDFSGRAVCRVGLDFGVLHEFTNRRYWTMDRHSTAGWTVAAIGSTKGSGQQVCMHARVEAPGGRQLREFSEPALAGLEFVLDLPQGREVGFDRLATNVVQREPGVPSESVWAAAHAAAADAAADYDTHLAAHKAAWAELWRMADVTIEGDDAAQQAIRFCIFNLLQTYHGVDPRCNVGAKGLTGEVYWGSAFWDTETYCLPFYALTCPPAGRNLVGFRHNTLKQAMERAAELDCRGARYPMVTIDGHESCGPWQYGELEIHVTAAVGYAAWHYVQITGDRDFWHQGGLEMLLQICRYFASRGRWNQRDNSFGFYGVMGPDEFHMMVHNNHYTNELARRLMLIAIDELQRVARELPAEHRRIAAEVGLDDAEVATWQRIAAAMRSKETASGGLIEQFDGYFDLPHIEISQIPLEQIPIQRTWVYTRIFETDMIKQPDVLMLLFLFASSYSTQQKRVNFDYYEPRCAHESSLSPSIHSILASELGYRRLAREYADYSLRLDLDDFNRNSHEGLHVTSMGAAWMSITYGFGGLRTDGDVLALAPTLPDGWTGYSFRINWRGSELLVRVGGQGTEVRLLEGPPLSLMLYGQRRQLDRSPLTAPLS